jgi:hypothetical protein
MNRAQVEATLELQGWRPFQARAYVGIDRANETIHIALDTSHPRAMSGAKLEGG